MDLLLSKKCNGIKADFITYALGSAEIFRSDDGASISIAERVCHKAIQILGEYAYLFNLLSGKPYPNAEDCQIYKGTTEVQNLLIGQIVKLGA